MKGTKFMKNQVKIRRRLYRKVARFGQYLSRRLRRERRVGQEES